jgi:hypothetical protein
MTIKATKSTPRERASGQNGLPELVPYVYRQQARRNTYAARIAQRNTGELSPSAAEPASPVVPASQADRLAVPGWLMPA